ncbi:MAG: hypothetical protein E4G98_04335 [Promethearchaeota archaeon]|nr:MAG: hypothetical protein E4G98_04335 [Candidatus Lokiarchaeota archaeon]
MKFKFSHLLGILGYGLWITYGIVMTVQSSGDTVPFWGLSERTTSAILLLIWPLAVGVIVMFISVKFLAPLFLWIKRKLQKHHTFAYLPDSIISLSPNQSIPNNLLPKVLFGRIFQLFLLTLGLVDAFINAGILLPENFVTSSQLDSWIVAGI